MRDRGEAPTLHASQPRLHTLGIGSLVQGGHHVCGDAEAEEAGVESGPPGHVRPAAVASEARSAAAPERPLSRGGEGPHQTTAALNQEHLTVSTSTLGTTVASRLTTWGQGGGSAAARPCCSRCSTGTSTPVQLWAPARWPPCTDTGPRERPLRGCTRPDREPHILVRRLDLQRGGISRPCPARASDVQLDSARCALTSAAVACAQHAGGEETARAQSRPAPGPGLRSSSSWRAHSTPAQRTRLAAHRCASQSRRRGCTEAW